MALLLNWFSPGHIATASLFCIGVGVLCLSVNLTIQPFVRDKSRTWFLVAVGIGLAGAGVHGLIYTPVAILVGQIAGWEASKYAALLLVIWMPLVAVVITETAVSVDTNSQLVAVVFFPLILLCLGIMQIIWVGKTIAADPNSVLTEGEKQQHDVELARRLPPSYPVIGDPEIDRMGWTLLVAITSDQIRKEIIAARENSGTPAGAAELPA